MAPESEAPQFEPPAPVDLGLIAAPTPRHGILDIAPYVGGESVVEGLDQNIKLSSNEGALGPSPKAIAAYRSLGNDLHRYPDGGARDLRDCLAEFLGLDVARIILGNGSGEIINHLVHAYAGPGDEVLYSEHGFLMYPLAAMACGATPVKAAETNYTASVDAFLASVTERTRIAFIANPNNPTGTYLPHSEMLRLRASLPDDVLLVVDSAYAEYVGRNDYDPGIELVAAYDNVVMTRTFSKIYGLAALRLGWAYCPAEIAQTFHRIRGPFNVNGAAQGAGIAALHDIQHINDARCHNDGWLSWMQGECDRLGLTYIPSVGNFLTIQFEKDSRTLASAVQAFLRTKGILLRSTASYGLPDHLRFTIGLEEENRAVMAALEEMLSCENGS